MPTDRRLKRLEKLALQRASHVVLYELADPRLTLVTLTRIKLSPDLSHGTIFWSSLEPRESRSKVEHALDRATGPVQGAIAEAFHTRRSPRVRFVYDESIEGALRVSKILDELEEERGEREQPETEEPEAEASGEIDADAPT